MDKIKIVLPKEQDSNIDLIELRLAERINIIRGDSATGKSFMTSQLQDIITNSGYDNITGTESGRLKVCSNEREVDSILNQNNKIIIIDRYDVYSIEAKEKIQRDIERLTNTWIIITRKCDFKLNIPVGLSMNSLNILDVKTEDKKKVLYMRKG